MKQALDPLPEGGNLSFQATQSASCFLGISDSLADWMGCTSQDIGVLIQGGLDSAVEILVACMNGAEGIREPLLKCRLRPQATHRLLRDTANLLARQA
jgi:hypothetical protein